MDEEIEAQKDKAKITQLVCSRTEAQVQVWLVPSFALKHLCSACIACFFFPARMQIFWFCKENQEIFFLSFFWFEIETQMSANASLRRTCLFFTNRKLNEWKEPLAARCSAASRAPIFPPPSHLSPMSGGSLPSGMPPRRSACCSVTS